MAVKVLSRCGFVLMLAFSFAVGTGTLEARPRSDAMLIIDSSISMSAKIGKKSKISLVRRALNPALKTAAPRLNLGVVFFGHRRRGDCTDAQYHIRLGSIRQKRYMEIINGIAPKGRAPVATAVNLAAGILKKRKKPGSIVLITDGFDACKPNLCTLGKQLQKKNPGLKVHVIALRSKSTKLAQLQCLARRTGGRYITATTANAVARAVETTFLIASGGKIPLPKSSPRRLQSLALAAEKSEDAANEKPQADTAVTALPENEIPSGGEKPVAIEPPVPPVVSAQTSKEPVDTKPGETTEEIFKSFFGQSKKTLDIIKTPAPVNGAPAVLKKPAEKQTSGLNLAARLGANGAIIDNDLFWRVYGIGENNIRAEEIRQTGAAQPLLELAPGQYDVTVQYGSVIQQQRVKIQADKITNAVIAIDAGIIQARAVRVAGGKSLDNDVSYTLLSEDKDEAGNRVEINRKTAASTHFIVKPGSYRLIGKLGSTTITTSLKVNAGKTLIADLVFNTGILKVSAIAGKGGAIINGATYVISQAQDDGGEPFKEIGKSSDEQNTFTLPAGTYLLKVQHGLAGIERTIEITANKTKLLVVNLNAGYLKLFASPAAGAGVLQDNVHYTIYKGEEALDGKREKITQSTKSSPEFWLPADKYFVTATYGLASANISVSVGANKRTEKTIVVNAGALRLSSMVEGLPDKLKSQVFYVIYDAKADIDGKYREVFSTGQAERVARIPPGEYIIEGRWGNTNARTPVSAIVAAGKMTDAVVIHRAGRVRFKLTEVQGGTPTGKPFWTFYDFTGTEIGRNVKPMPERIFAAGKYTVVVRYNDQEFKAEFSIKSGDEKQIDIVARQ